MGVKFNRLTEGKQYFHMENNTVENCAAGVVDWGDKFPVPTFSELILVNNRLIDNNSNNIRIRGAIRVHEYGSNIGITKARAGTVTPIHHSSGTPSTHNVGYTTWGNP